MGRGLNTRRCLEAPHWKRVTAMSRRRAARYPADRRGADAGPGMNFTIGAGCAADTEPRPAMRHGLNLGRCAKIAKKARNPRSVAPRQPRRAQVRSGLLQGCLPFDGVFRLSWQAALTLRRRHPRLCVTHRDRLRERPLDAGATAASLTSSERCQLLRSALDQQMSRVRSCRAALGRMEDGRHSPHRDAGAPQECR
jgi:hypothetical protein